MEIDKWIESRDCRELARLVPNHVTTSDGSIFIHDSRNARANIRVSKNGFYDFDSGMSGGYVLLASLIKREHNEPVCGLISKFYRESLEAVIDVDNEQTKVLRKNISQLMGYID